MSQMTIFLSLNHISLEVVRKEKIKNTDPNSGDLAKIPLSLEDFSNLFQTQNSHFLSPNVPNLFDINFTKTKS